MPKVSSAPTQTRVARTFCHFCPWRCGIDVHVAGGKIVKVEGTRENPYSRGEICAKAELGIIDYEYSPDRLLYPLAKKNGGWQRISWDEALETIAAKFLEIKERYGPGALTVGIGDPLATRRAAGGNVLWRLCDVYGTPSRLGVGAFCSVPQRRAREITYGKEIFPQPEHAKSIIVWGINPQASFMPIVKPILDGIKKGAKLIVIDPKRTEFARKADVYLQLRPGTDAALALGMLHTIITEGLYDKAFVPKWTVGFDRLVEHIKDYPPEKVEGITGVPAEAIKKAARIHATNRPGCVVPSIGSMDKQASGFQAFRAISILQAILGNIDVMGGEVAASFLPERSLKVPEKMKDVKLLGAEEFPLFYEVFGMKTDYAQATNWADMVLSGRPYPIKALLVSGGNPALTRPHTQRFKEAVQKLEFMVVMDVFMTETAEMADIVLPAATFLERYDLHFYHGRRYAIPYIMMSKPVVEPPGECWNDVIFYFELARQMGYGEYFPWENESELIDYVLEPSGLTFKYLLEEKPAGVTYGEILYQDYEKKGFRTPSGKVEIYSETLEKLGYAPLPTYREPPESLVSTPELAREYPLVLTTASRLVEYWHSEHRMLPRLRGRVPEPTAEIHPDTAARYGIKDGEMVVVETKRGRIEIKAQLTEDIVPGVVSIVQGWKQANVNLLTDETPAVPETGSPSLGAMLCKVTRKGGPKSKSSRGMAK